MGRTKGSKDIRKRTRATLTKEQKKRHPDKMSQKRLQAKSSAEMTSKRAFIGMFARNHASDSQQSDEEQSDDNEEGEEQEEAKHLSTNFHDDNEQDKNEGLLDPRNTVHLTTRTLDPPAVAAQLDTDNDDLMERGGDVGGDGDGDGNVEDTDTPRMRMPF